VAYTSISPEIDNDTRWASQLKMLLSFIDLYYFLSIRTFSDETIDLIPNATKKRKVESLIKSFAQIEVVNKDFHTCDASRITLSYVRTCFDGLIESFSE